MGEGGYSWLGGWKFKVRLFQPDQPLWLPKGSVRALLVLIVTSAILYLILRGVPVPDKLWDLDTFLVGIYVGGRLNFHAGEKGNGKVS